MDTYKFYRKRLIPSESIYLKDDTLVYFDEEIFLTKWPALTKKDDLHHGCSCYYLDKGFRISQFFDKNNQLLCWYCDIIEVSLDTEKKVFLFTDLLADVIYEPGGIPKVVDLDELSQAFEQQLLSTTQLLACLSSLDNLLQYFYTNTFDELIKPFERFTSIN